MQELNIWLTALDASIKAALIGLVGVVITAVIALIVVWAQNRMAKRAIWVQERTAFLQLIDRRAAWLDRYNNAILTFLREHSSSDDVGENRLERLRESRAFKEIIDCHRSAPWLFGNEVKKSLDRAFAILNSYTEKVAEFRAQKPVIRALKHEDRKAAMTSLKILMDDLRHGQSAILTAQKNVEHDLRLYLFVGDIRHRKPMKM